jgi:hypothetical protein
MFPQVASTPSPWRMRSATVFEMALLKLVVERRKAKPKPLMKSALLMPGQKIIFP